MSDEDHSEIIFIRKRHGDEDEGHHGGVWKLAFADFMTAMMAFFLVMWLINSTSKETKAAIVQYFNPVQLVDGNPGHKGLRDPNDGAKGKSPQQPAAEAPPKSTPMSDKAKDGPAHEAALLYDPMTTLDEIAATSAPQSTNPKSAKPGREPPTFGDPFDRSVHGPGYVDERLLEDNRSPDKSALSEQGDESVAKPVQLPPSSPAQKLAPDLIRPSPLPSIDDKSKSDAPSVASVRSAIDKVVKTEMGASRVAPQIEIAETPEGLVISLTDDANFSMFAVGSVEPKPQLVRIIGQIGRILSKQAGDVELRGHTDGRSYKSATYDNWRLSSDRANMAYYMLVRGGLAEKRVVRISGYADRRLKNAKDPLAAVNRRIEILLRRGER